MRDLFLVLVFASCLDICNEKCFKIKYFPYDRLTFQNNNEKE